MPASDHSRNQQPNWFSFNDTRWQIFNVVRQGLRAADLVLPISPIDPTFEAFFLHSSEGDDANRFIFAEKPKDKDSLPKSFEAVVDDQGFTLTAKTGIRDEDWDSGIVDDEAGKLHMELQDELGVSEPNAADIERFSKLVMSLVKDLTSR